MPGMEVWALEGPPRVVLGDVLGGGCAEDPYRVRRSSTRGIFRELCRHPMGVGSSLRWEQRVEEMESVVAPR